MTLKRVMVAVGISLAIASSAMAQSSNKLVGTWEGDKSATGLSTPRVTFEADGRYSGMFLFQVQGRWKDEGDGRIRIWPQVVEGGDTCQATFTAGGLFSSETLTLDGSKCQLKVTNFKRLK